MAERRNQVRQFILWLEATEPNLQSWQATAKRLRETWDIWD